MDIADYFKQTLLSPGGFYTGAASQQNPYYSFDFDRNVKGFNGQQAWDSYYTQGGDQNVGRTDSHKVFQGSDGGNLLTYLDPDGNYIVAPSVDLGGQFFGKQASKLNGTGWDRYSKDGQYLGSGQYSGLKDSSAAPWMGAGMMLGGIGATMYGLGGAAAAGAGAAEGAGAGVAGAGEIAAGNGAFLGEGVASGIGGWDAAAWAAAGGSPLAAGAAGAGLGAGAGAAAGGAASSLIPGISNSVLGAGASVLGGLLGGQGQSADQSTTRQLPGYLQGPVANDLIPRTQQMLGNQMSAANTAGNTMLTQGMGMLNAPVAGNGVGQVKLNAPTTSTNPYLTGMADDISRRTQEMLGQNNLAIQGNAVGVGGLGGSRQGVAQGLAASKAADYLQGNLSNLYGTQYSNDQNRALQQYGMDQGFYTGQRGQDLAQAGMGANMLGQGLQTQWSPIENAAKTYGQFSGMGTTTQNQSSGGGLGGVLGGALGTAQLGKNMGWW